MSFQVLNLQPSNFGGNGNIATGQRSDNGERVAVKFLRENASPHARKGFAREVRLLQRGLPGLMPIYSANTNTERPYYVMPHLNGGVLTRYAGGLTCEALELIATQIAHTLAGLHAALEAHGDIKPDNILVTQEGQILVADPLGNGAVLTMLFSPNSGGTPGYCAPEVRAGNPISYAADVYSYGATIYELSTGRKPIDGQRPALTSSDRKRAPKICEIITACCQLAPESRPTMQDVLRMLNGEIWEHIQEARRRSREALGTACLIGLVVLAGLALVRR